MGSLARRLENAIAEWPYISIHTHRFGGREFRLEKAEVGHVHFWGDLDIPFTRPIRDNLIDSGVVQQHRWVPNSGWTTFRMNRDPDLETAVWLARLSWLRFALKKESDPLILFEEECKTLHLNDRLTYLLKQFLPNRGRANTGGAALLPH